MEEDRPIKRLKSGSEDIFDTLNIEDLPNGIRCYFIKTDHSLDTGSISLVVKAGMLYEQPSEAGVAHFLEHLVVRAAMEASNSSFLRCLSSHAHHETALTHTVFPFQISQPREILEAFNLYGLIADRKLVIKESQVKAERKVIAMEYKENVQDKITCAGDKLHCSLVEGAFSCETCLNNLMHIDSTMVNDFYQKWYISSQMALLIIGNFDAKELFTIARQSFSGEKPDVGIPVTIKDQSWTSELIIVKDAANALAFKLGRSSNLRETWVWNMIVNAIDKRLKDSCQGFAYIVEKELSTFIMLASYVNVEELVYENLRLLEWGLTSSEVEREQNEIRKSLRRNATLFQLDKDYQIRVLQTKLRDHFLFGKKITSPILEVEEFQAQISLYIRDYLKRLEIARARIYLRGPSFRSRDSLIAKVKKRFLAPWDDTRKVVNFDEHWKCDNQVPPSIKQLKEIGMQEFNLSNGMRVLLCQSRVPYDCAMYGFAYGGLFERDEKNYLSSYFALDIAQQLPTFAFNYNLFGREKIKMNLDIQDYIRSFEALFETDELNVALQLVYLLFCKKPELAKVRVNPMRTKYEMVNEYASEPSFYHKVPTNEDASQVNVPDGVKFFSECFLDPSQFTVVIVGPFDMKIAATSVQKYLGSIPRVVCNTFPLAKSGLKKLRINFPEKAVRHNIHHDLSFKEVYICIPVKMDKEKQDVDEVLIEYLKAIVEQKIKILLRCEMGEVYSVSAEAVFDGKVYSSPGNEEAFLRLRFCHDSDTLLIDRALQLIEDLPNALSEADLACLPSYLEQAKFSSASILAEVVQAYHAKQYNGHLEEIILERRKMLQELSRFNHDLQFWKSIFKRMMPYQCTRRHVCVVFHEAGKESEPEDVAEYVDDGVSFEEYLDDEQSDDDSDTIHIIPYDSEEEDEEESVGDSDEEGSDTIPDDSEEEDEEESDGDSDEEGSDTIPDDSEEEHENKSD